MGDMTVGDKVCLDVVTTCDKSQSFLVTETPGEELCDHLVPRGSVFKQIMGVQRKPFLVVAVSQVFSAQNNQYTKEAYLGVACLELLHRLI